MRLVNSSDPAGVIRLGVHPVPVPDGVQREMTLQFATADMNAELQPLVGAHPDNLTEIAQLCGRLCPALDKSERIVIANARDSVNTSVRDPSTVLVSWSYL
jgi:hypothetical protein